MDIGYKFNRILRLGRKFGYFRSLVFELQWTARLNHVSITTNKRGCSFVLRRESSDISVFEQIFVAEELNITLDANIEVIIDAGANVGFSTAYLASRYPNARIIAIEPDSGNLRMLRKNCKGFQNVEVVEGGLWSQVGHLRIANPDSKQWSYQCEPARPEQEGAFKSHTVESLLSQFNLARCDLLKLDVEGAEREIFARREPWMTRVGAILVEVHSAEAERNIRSVCPEGPWRYEMHGEKLLILAQQAKASLDCGL